MGYGRNGKTVLLLQVIIVAGALGGAYVFFSYEVVPPNYVGIRHSDFWGKVDLQRTYPAGRHFIGVTYAFYLYPTTIQEFSFTKAEEEATAEECTECVITRSTDGLQIIVEAWVQYAVQTDRITELFQKYGTFSQLQDRLFSVIRTTINDVISTKAGIIIYSQRQAVTVEIKGTLRERMLVYFVDVLDHGLRSIDFPDAFEQAQLEKRVAQEKIETAEFERQQAVINAQRQVIEAQATANITVIQAEAEANAAYAVREQLEMSNREYLQWLYLQQLGNLEEPQIIIVTGDEVPEFLIPIEKQE